MSMLAPTVVAAHIKSGKVRGLGVSYLKRSMVLPDIPTLHEAGVKDYEALQWHGFLAPAKTPSTTITRIHAEVIKALTSSEVKERFIS
jgi:tripartite-type tricarboxylate transporter receptor subunit TctC